MQRSLSFSILSSYQMLPVQQDVKIYWHHNGVILLPYAHLTRQYTESDFSAFLHKHKLLPENEYPLPTQFQLMEYLDGYNPQENDLRHVLISQRLLLDEYARYLFSSFRRSLLFQSSHFLQSAAHLEKFDRQLSYPDKNNVCGQILFLKQYRSLKREMLSCHNLSLLHLTQVMFLDTLNLSG